MTGREMIAMLRFADRGWCFPGSRIDSESEFEWRDSGAYLLEPDGTAVKGILCVGEVDPSLHVR
jgi:hypothetical protein